MRILDAVTGRVTMYRLVAIVLGAIALTAIALATAGQLAYGWLQLLVSLAVLLAATVAASTLAALPFRVRPQLDSALVTALLLFFLLPPPRFEGVAELGVLALAGGVAGASKFLIAWRGRHLLNPAAAGAVAVTATGLSYSGWWVATPPLFPIVLVGALVVLLRVRRLPLAVLFVAVATAIELARYLPTTTPADAAATIFLSLPTVFLAGFMLSEPLTLPPLRWQRALVGAVVAVLFAVPFHLGPVDGSPQLAILAGNVIGFAFGQRRGIRLELLDQRELAPGTREIALRPLRPLRFRPGQYLELDLPHRGADLRGRRRLFSISSAAADGTITIAMSHREPLSSFKRALFALTPGSRLSATGVAGDFTLPERGRLLLVAGGIGITPFAAQLGTAQLGAAQLGTGRHPLTTVVYATSAAGPPYREVLEASGARVVLFAPTEPERMPAGWSYAGPGRLSAERILAAVPDAGQYRAFVAGPPGFVAELRRQLRRAGVRRVTTDAFTGY
ncbi:MAG: FAD-dependent oxidoreductase [Microbacteriaceae bacterium]